MSLRVRARAWMCLDVPGRAWTRLTCLDVSVDLIFSMKNLSFPTDALSLPDSTIGSVARGVAHWVPHCYWCMLLGAALLLDGRSVAYTLIR